MKLVVVASVLDLALPFGCTPAWWQLLKALHELGHELIVTPYHGRAVESLWWRSYDNPCYGLGQAYATLRRVGRAGRSNPASRARPDGRESTAQRLQRGLIERLVKPRWRAHLATILERERPVDAVLVLTVPLNHLGGLATDLRRRFGVPVCFFDGDMPASLPSFGGFASGFDIYHGADVSEYDGMLSNSQGSLAELERMGARRTGVLWWGADPGVFRPVPVAEDVDVFFYGLGTEYRRDWLESMITIPSRRLPQARFVVAGAQLDMDLGRAERIGPIPTAQLNHHAARAKINLNIARSAHASVHASATTRLFELAAMERAIVTNPLLGLEVWFEPGREIEVVRDAEQAVQAYERLLQRPDERQRLAAAARRRVLQEHTYAHRAETLVRFLASLPAAGRPGATA